MKIPTSPHLTTEDLRKAMVRAQDPEVLDTVFRENARYLHWDEMYRRKKYPLDPLSLWALMKFFRGKQAHTLSFADRDFQYVLDDSCWKELHALDKTAAGEIFRLLDPAGPDRDQYIVSSLMEEAIATGQLADAATRRSEAKQMLRERRKPRTNDERIILNSYLAMKEVRTLTGSDLTPDLILRLHATITAGTLENPDDEVRFRDNDEIRVVDSSGTVLYTPLPCKEIPQLIDELCRFVNRDQEGFMHPIVKGIILHFLFCWIHPFDDGNGRCARILFYWYAAKQDYRLFEYMTISRAIKDTKDQYQKAYLYTETDENDLTYFIRYNLGTLSNAIRETQRSIRKKKEELSELLEIIRDREELTSRQADILSRFMKYREKSFKIKEIMEIYRVANKTARSDLFRIEELGYVRKEKTGREMVFWFKEIARKG